MGLWPANPFIRFFLKNKIIKRNYLNIKISCPRWLKDASNEPI